jgi:hypothetical protein
VRHIDFVFLSKTKIFVHESLTQTLYAHVNKRNTNNKKKEKSLSRSQILPKYGIGNLISKNLN